MMTRTLFNVLIFYLMMACGSASENICPDASCANYATRPEAQAAYDNDPDCLKGLLSNDKVCPNLPQTSTVPTPPTGGSSCPTTANCGCSSKNKSQCSGPCCKWVVGAGCQCF